MLHETFDAISFVSSPSSRVLIKTCCAASSCSAKVVDDTIAADSGGLEKRKEGRIAGQPILPLSGTTVLKMLIKTLATLAIYSTQLLLRSLHNWG